jgi:hypothetical protein
MVLLGSLRFLDELRLLLGRVICKLRAKPKRAILAEVRAVWLFSCEDCRKGYSQV